jgi:hypothetical protein
MLQAMPIVWVGNKPNKDLAIVSFTGSKLQLDHSYRSSNKFVAPVRVDGTRSFQLLAAWDHNDRTESLNTGTSTVPDTHGSEEALRAHTLIRSDRTPQGKCCVSSSSIRSYRDVRHRHDNRAPGKLRLVEMSGRG